MDELKPLQRTDFTAMDGDFGPTLIRHTHPGGKWADVENVQIREKMLRDALQDLLDYNDMRYHCWMSEDRKNYIDLLTQFDAEENQ